MSTDNLTTIPGVGPRIAEKLRRLGIHQVSDLKDRDPEHLYLDYNHLVGRQADRCLLYVFRCAVYFAETQNPQEGKLKWWNWKD